MRTWRGGDRLLPPRGFFSRFSRSHVSLDACDLPAASPLLPEYDVYDLRRLLSLAPPQSPFPGSTRRARSSSSSSSSSSETTSPSSGAPLAATSSSTPSATSAVAAPRAGDFSTPSSTASSFLPTSTYFLALVTSQDIARPDADEWKPFLAAKRAFLADGDYAHAHATLFLLCRRDVAAIRSRLRNATPTEGDGRPAGELRNRLLLGAEGTPASPRVAGGNPAISGVAA